MQRSLQAIRLLFGAQESLAALKIHKRSVLMEFLFQTFKFQNQGISHLLLPQILAVFSTHGVQTMLGSLVTGTLNQELYPH